jgi:hypothetical protein
MNDTTARPVEAEVVPPGTRLPVLHLPRGWTAQLTVFALGVTAGIALCWFVKHKL